MDGCTANTSRRTGIACRLPRSHNVSKTSFLFSCGLITALLASEASAVQFNTWIDEHGVRHHSNIPRECITENKTLRPECKSLVESGEPQAAAEAVTRMEEEKAARESAIRKESLERYLEDSDPMNQMRKEAAAYRDKQRDEYQRQLLQSDPNKYIEERRYRRELEKRKAEDRALSESRQRAREELRKLESEAKDQ